MKITINDQVVEAVPGQTVLEVCEHLNIKIPTFCHDKRLVPHGACRMCVVEVEGVKGLPTACTLPAYEGMVIKTHTKMVEVVRKDILELMWASHDNNCLVCSQAGQCKLQDYCYIYDIAPETTKYKKRLSHHKDESNKFYTINRDKCILCGKCVRVCHELQGTGAIGYSERGFYTHITHPFEMGMEHSNCVSCGNCVNVCPTGAIAEKIKIPFRNWEIEKKVKTTCGYCGVGCQINLVVKDNQVVRIEPVEDEINHGLLCVKGKFAYNFIGHPDRLTKPLIKQDDEFVEATWDEALDLIVTKIEATKKAYGSDSFAALASARCTTEDNYMMQKLFRAVIGTNSVDHCARL